MLHRLKALLLVWLVLLGAASPALACAMADRDCCLADSTAPCDNPDPAKSSSGAECIGVNAASPAVCAESIRSRAVLDALGSPQPLIAAGPSLPFVRTIQPLRFTALTHSSSRPDAALTYLHTGRLRL